MSNHQAPIPSPSSGGWLKVAKDIVAGTAGGISVTLVGHPFDTLKVRLQTQSQAKPLYSELISCHLLYSTLPCCFAPAASGSMHAWDGMERSSKAHQRDWTSPLKCPFSCICVHACRSVPFVVPIDAPDMHLQVAWSTAPGRRFSGRAWAGSIRWGMG